MFVSHGFQLAFLKYNFMLFAQNLKIHKFNKISKESKSTRRKPAASSSASTERDRDKERESGSGKWECEERQLKDVKKHSTKYYICMYAHNIYNFLKILHSLSLFCICRLSTSTSAFCAAHVLTTHAGGCVGRRMDAAPFANFLCLVAFNETFDVIHFHA